MPKTIPVVVTTQDCQIDFQVNPKVTGREFLKQTHEFINVRQLCFFGLQYYDAKGRLRWVKESKKLPIKKDKEKMHFMLKVKYYPEEVSEELLDDNSVLQFYYQVKEDIISGQIYCSAETCVLLAGYQAFFRHGKYDPALHKKGFLKVDKYIPATIREQYDLTDEDWEARIVNAYSEIKDLIKEEAAMEYLKIAQDLEMFGVTYFKIRNPNQTDLFLGVDALGLNIYENGNKLIPKISFSWNEIQRLSYMQYKFTVKPVDASGKSLTVYTDDVRVSKEIMQLCTGNHELYAIRRRPDTIEVQQMKAKAKELQVNREAIKEKFRSEERARQLLESRLQEMQRVADMNKEAYTRTQNVLDQYKEKVNELRTQLDIEMQARQQLEELKRHLEEANRKFEQENIQSAEERAKLASERDTIQDEIDKQMALVSKFEQEKRMYEDELSRVRAEHNETLQRFNEDLKQTSDECEFEALDVQDEERLAKVETDLDHAQRLKQIKFDLSSARNVDKMKTIDKIYEENVSKGMDKYRTLRAIREGNTKKRVDQFESM